jgi:hypothetical protein
MLRTFFMPKKKKKVILKRNSDIPTEYYATGKTTIIRNVGEFPSMVKRLDEDGKVESTYLLGAITADFIYYLDKEYDNEDGTVMINRKMQLISDNFLASNDLAELVGRNVSLLWMSKTVKIWQREQYIQPHLLTPEVRKALNKVDIETLTKKQKEVYFAFLNNGPVKYTKAEALMAVLSNTDQLPDIILKSKNLLGNE